LAAPALEVERALGRFVRDRTRAWAERAHLLG